MALPPGVDPTIVEESVNLCYTAKDVSLCLLVIYIRASHVRLKATTVNPWSALCPVSDAQDRRSSSSRLRVEDQILSHDLDMAR